MALAALLGLAVGVGALAGAPPASAAGTNFERDDAGAQTVTLDEQLAGLRDSRWLKGEPLITGRVTAPSGFAVASGTPVYVEVWPTEEDLAAQEVGDTFDLVPIGKAKTGADGRFEVRVDPDVNLPALMKGGSYIDATLVAGTGGDAVHYAFSIEEQAATVDIAGADAALPEAATVDRNSGLTSRGVGADLVLGGVGRLAGEGVSNNIDEESSTVVEEHPGDGEGVNGDEDAAEGTADVAPTDFSNGCPTTGTKKVAHLGDRWVNVGNLFAQKGLGKVRWEYSTGAESSLGVGVSATGKFGTFSRSGTITRERRVNMGWGWYKAPRWRYLDTQYSYGKYCTTTRSPGPSFKFTVKAIKHRGGDRQRKLNGFPSYLTECKPRSAGANGSVYESNAVTWNTGAKLDAKIGLDLTSSTGFRRSAEFHYDFAKKGRLCGKDDVPAGRPRVVGMRTT
ncbi:hypothetical protein GCM10028784_35630 [Myceligenerans cantabricum]